jgi:hypothetical protein
MEGQVEEQVEEVIEGTPWRGPHGGDPVEGTPWRGPSGGASGGGHGGGGLCPTLTELSGMPSHRSAITSAMPSHRHHTSYNGRAAVV